jgi:uncharacterized protein YceK
MKGHTNVITQISLALVMVIALTALSGCASAVTREKEHRGAYRDVHDYYPREKKEQGQPEKGDSVESEKEL